MRHVAVLALCVALSACEKTPTEGAVLVAVNYTTYTPACLRVMARDELGNKGDTEKGKTDEWDEKQVLKVAVFRKPDWGRELTVEVSIYDGWDGNRCVGRVVETHTSESLTVPVRGSTSFEVYLQAQDEDGDGQVDRECPRCDTPPNTGCYEGGGTCNLSTGQCEYTRKSAQTPCNDANACTEGDACDGNGQCVGKEKQCNQSTNVCNQSAGQCNAATGSCTYPALEANTPCDDGNACTGEDRCDGTGACRTTPFETCSEKDCRMRAQVCAPSGMCTYTPDPMKKDTACKVDGVSGKCNSNGECKSFSFDPSNFNPDAITTDQIFGRFLINCGDFGDPLIFNSDTLNWTQPTGCALPTPKAVTRDLSDGQKAAVIPMSELMIEQGKMLRALGTRPVILAVYGNATLHGALRANGRGSIPGAGGNHTVCGNQTGGNGRFENNAGSGGGGGAFGNAGAAGGKNEVKTDGGNGGTPALLKLLVPLVGGCAGGSGGMPVTSGGAGGVGGGALQLAVSGTLRVDSSVSVSGGGGGGGASALGGGGGGGSGGGLLLEAHRLELTSLARFTANGGGGGEAGTQGTTGESGEDGSRTSDAPATGGSSGGGGRNGGSGGAEGAGAIAGSDGTSGEQAGGGGGGGVGVIRARGISSCDVDESCDVSDNSGCLFSPNAVPECPPRFP